MNIECAKVKFFVIFALTLTQKYLYNFNNHKLYQVRFQFSTKLWYNADE